MTKIKNAKIIDKTYKTSLNNVNADIDFSQDMVILKQVSAFFNEQPITISGKIDKLANADILIRAENIPLKIIGEL